MREIEYGLKKRDRELTVEVMSLVAKYEQAKDAAAQADIQKELTKSVEGQFQLRQETRAKELAELEDQLKRLRSVHDQRTAEKDRIVQDRVHQLLRDSSGLGWGTEPGTSRGVGFGGAGMGGMLPTPRGNLAAPAR